MAAHFPAAEYPDIDPSLFADLYKICREGHLEELRNALSYEKKILDYFSVRRLRGYTLLHEAVEADQPDVVQMLLLHGVSPNLRAKGGLTPLHLACSKSLIDCVRALLENGADISLRDDLGHDAHQKAEVRNSKKKAAIMKLLRNKEIILHSSRGEIHALEKKLHHSKPDSKDIEEALLVAIQNGHDFCIPTLVVSGARRLDCALYLAIQLERVKAIAILLLCKATITGDCAVIKSLLSEPPEAQNAPWYMAKVHSILSQGVIKMSYPIAVSIMERNYEATRELLLRTDLDMHRKQVDWSKLKLTILHPTWMYSISPWVVTLKLVNNHLRKLPVELFSATQLRRLDLSQNLLEGIEAEIFAMPNLEYLSLAHNRIRELPETSAWSQSLLSLDLAENSLTTLPQGIQNSRIEILNLSKNHFTAIPKCLCRVTTLTSLDLSSTQINSFPPEMQHLDHLVNLNVSNANISDLPGGGAILRGAVKGIFRARARSSKSSNYIKLVLLCNSDRVKSAMLSRLKPHFTNSDAGSLPEFDQFQWSYRPLFTRKLFGSHKLHFNTWLLGSSYEYNSIYPCFFTPGALYVLVWDVTKSADMREQMKAYVDHMVRYVPTSNVLIINILPEGYENWIETNYESHSRRMSGFFAKPSYSSLIYHGLMMVVAKQNVKEGQSDIKQQIYDVASSMTVNGQLKVTRQHPETYFHLIPLVEKEQQGFQSRQKPGVLEEPAVWSMFDRALASDPPHRMELPVMIDFLQEAGFLLHYEDPNERLDQFYFLRPTWLYHTLLKIVRHTLQCSTHPEITHAELCSLAGIRDVNHALVRLMTRYAVVVPTRGGRYLVSCLLPHCNPPSAELNCGYLRRQFAPKSRSLPYDLWVRIISRILSHLPRLVDMSNTDRPSEAAGTLSVVEGGRDQERPNTDEETDEVGLKTKKRLPPMERCSSTPSSMVVKARGGAGGGGRGGGGGKAFPSITLIGKSASVDTGTGSSSSRASPRTSPQTSPRASPTTSPAKERVATPSELTVLHISNKERIEESDDGITPVDDRSRFLSRGEGKSDPPPPATEKGGGVLTDAHKEDFELKEMTSPKRDVSVSPARSPITPPPPQPVVEATVTPPTPQHATAAAAGNTESLGDSSGEVAGRREGEGKGEEPREDTDGKLHRSSKSVAHPGKTGLSTSTHITKKTSQQQQPHPQPHPSQSQHRLQRNVSLPVRKRDPRTGGGTSTSPVQLEKGIQVWDAGIMHCQKGVRFSVYPCRCDLSTVEERGVEVCSDQTREGRVVFARLCRLVQQLLQERYPDMFSVDLLLHKHELTQLAVCPVCLEAGERNPTTFLVEACVHALLDKSVHNCRHHPKSVPLDDLIPDYLMGDFPSSLQLRISSSDFNESQPLHKGRSTNLYEGRVAGKVVAIKMYHHMEGKTITLPLYQIRQELEMLLHLDHPNVVRTFGYSLQPHCMVLERAPMSNLYQKLMDTEQRISRAVRFHIACQVASALDYLHSQDVIYRTLKASSILLWSLDFAEEVSVKLANFERAQFKSPSGLLGKTSFASYPAPEMLRYSFREEYSEKVDIYSFGILLYELVTRWQPFGGVYNTDRIPVSQRPKLSGVNTVGYGTLVRLMEECWQEDSTLRPSASNLIGRLSLPAFQCHIATQVLRDCTSVRDCCFVPSVRQVWVYGEYNKDSGYGDGDVVEGTQVFILNSETLTIQGTLEFKERASALFTVDSKVWIGMTEACVHAYDTTTFRFTDRFKLSDSVTVIADNDSYIFVAQANGHLSCFPKLAQKESQVIDVEIGSKAIIAMITVSDILWLSCGNELVILSADDDQVTVEARWTACSPADQIYRLVLSKDVATVWSIVKNNHAITSWDVHTGEKKHETDLQEDIRWICCELNYDPTYLRLVSVECVRDTLWLGLTCGVIVVLTACERPQKIAYFRAHRSSPKVIKEIPAQEEGGAQDCPVVLTGGFGEVSPNPTASSDQNGVIMSWHALNASDFQLASKRYSRYFHANR